MVDPESVLRTVCVRQEHTPDKTQVNRRAPCTHTHTHSHPPVHLLACFFFFFGRGRKVKNQRKPRQVGTNLTDLTLRKRRVTVRELGGCMGPIWPSYFRDCTSVIFMVDSANITQISSSCIQLLGVLSAEPLRSASVLVLFNKRDLPCTMSLEEMKSLFRMDDIIASAPQSITVLELSARSGKGLQEVLNWLDSTQPD
ncbi:ADP-ribosylation factor-like protein 16 isoform X1 [Pangasianodon hypophthalmus]|uniref:ADP-ribosylation factor-like protein 16 isoform X1 n=1 Tax=Pangasianodon hypophthalmus TaxID=310915 RepID=UPI00230777DE|nr:ADP-ribosylation factor-like protein 16 isoform X1 [Pangasianodon hypophthalmus]